MHKNGYHLSQKIGLPQFKGKKGKINWLILETTSIQSSLGENKTKLGQKKGTVNSIKATESRKSWLERLPSLSCKIHYQDSLPAKYWSQHSISYDRFVLPHWKNSVIQSRPGKNKATWNAFAWQLSNKPFRCLPVSKQVGRNITCGSIPYDN